MALPEALAAEVQRLLFEHRHAEHLRVHHLAPRMRVLLIGPPGTGKTVLAGALAGALQLPLLVVDYGRLISSYMGATGANITLLADALMDTPCVLFIDEMDTVLSERAGQSSRSDVGEQARVVTTLLLALDRIGAAGRVVIVGATNHAELLDRAVRRRFELELHMPLADAHTVSMLADRLSALHPGLDMRRFIPATIEGRSLAQIEAEILASARCWVLEQLEAIPEDA